MWALLPGVDHLARIHQEQPQRTLLAAHRGLESGMEGKWQLRTLETPSLGELSLFSIVGKCANGSCLLCRRRLFLECSSCSGPWA